MEKINFKNMEKINFKNLFNKNLLTIFIFVFVIFGILFSGPKIFAQDSGVATNEAVKSIENLGNNGKGLIPDCGRTAEGVITNKVCSPKDAVKLIASLGQVFVYLVIIALVLMLVISGIGYVYYGENPEYIKKWKKYIKNSLYALLIIMGVFTVLFGLLSTLGFNSELLNFFKNIFAFNDLHSFNLFPHAMAQEVPAVSSGGSGYVNFFPQQTIGSLILLTIKFLINYIAGPILVISVIITGFMFVKAQGNATELDKAKKFAMRVVIAIVIAAAAQMIVMITLNTVKDISSQASGSATTTTK